MGKKVLIIDDDHDFVEAITILLESKGYDVIARHNGSEGMEAASREKPGIILLDVMMSEKTEGFNVARKIRSEEGTKDIPIIMISGIRKEMNLPFDFEPDSEMLPVNVFLEKPVKPEELLKKVSENYREN